MSFTRRPDQVIRQSEALVLTSNDDYACILLQQGDQRSILKLTSVPTLGLPVPERLTSLEALREHTIQTDEKTKEFLHHLSFDLSSDSGAEYSYYDVTKGWQLGNLLPGPKDVAYKAELISPASDRQVQRALPSADEVMVLETPEMYSQVTLPHITNLLESGSTSWIQNVLDGSKEKERMLLDHDDFILNVDTKWRSHPDAAEVPRSEWFEHESTKDLYCLAIVKDTALRSLRDVRRKHVQLLREMEQKGVETIGDVYGVAPQHLRVFVHYHPQFYHFHIHFTRLDNEIGCLVERGHLISDIVQNLELESMYYAKRNIATKLKTSSELYQRFGPYL